MSKKIIIAIDGFSSCGKSTVAKSLAKELQYSFIDTGAMYRAVTYHMLQKKVDYTDLESVLEELKSIKIEFEFNAEREASDVILNDKNIEKEIRQMWVSSNVSNFATIKEVRQAMVAQQQEMGKKGGIVMDGRDIGTVVFPNAELKIFMTASPEVRAQRRFKELSAKGDNVSLGEIKQNLQERDHIDSTRAESPLKQAEDARVLDNSNLTVQEQLEIAKNWISVVITS